MDKHLFLKLSIKYIIFREFLYKLSAEPAGSSNDFSTQLCNHVDFLQLSAPAFNHFDDGSALCADASDCSFDIASSVVFSIGSENAGTDCKLGVRTVGTSSGVKGEGMHLLESDFCGHLI
jgi:hypothetical protein